MRDTINEAWNLVLNDPDFEFVPYYLGALAVVAFLAMRSRGGWGDGGGGDGGCGGDGGGGE